MRVETFLSQSTARCPGKSALVAGAVRLSYAELDAQSTRLAAHLQRIGVARNDRVLVFMDSAAEAAVAVFAVLKAGATFSPINASTKADKLDFIVGNCRPTAILTRMGPDWMGFELHAATDRIEEWLQVRSEISIAVHSALTGAGITLR